MDVLVELERRMAHYALAGVSQTPPAVMMVMHSHRDVETRQVKTVDISISAGRRMEVIDAVAWMLIHIAPYMEE